MMFVLLERFAEVGGATCGTLRVPGAAHPLLTMEPPWRNNEPFVSCLPAGEYRCIRRFSEKFRRETFLVLENFPERDAIEFHPGIFARNTKGCIMVAMGVVFDIGKEPRLVASDIGFSYFMTLAQKVEEFSLSVVDKIAKVVP